MAALDPFIHMDQMGEVEYGPGEPKGTPWHPHRGFETVTYMIDGTFQHQDSIGGGGLITNGATQWMTAGAGILHIERPPDDLVASGGLFHGIQLWVNLPAADKWVAPALPGHRAAGRDAALVAGRRRAGPRHRRSGRRPGRPGDHVHADLARPRHRQPRAPGSCCRGRPSSTPSSTCSPAAAPSVRTPGRSTPASWPSTARVTRSSSSADRDQESRSPNLDVLVLGGRPIGEPVAAYGPFVMNTKDELAQAFEDFHAGRLGTIPADHIGD